MEKAKAMGKITVRHYLNTNLKPYKVDGDKLYKLYFLVRYQNKNTKIKSLIDVELTEKEYSEKIKDENDILSIRIKNEKRLVENTIEIAVKIGQPFEIKIFRIVWDIASYPIIENFEKWINLYKSRMLPGYVSGDSFLYDNIETFENTLNSLKLFIVNSNHSITNELFLMQFFDKEIINDYKKGLSKEELKQIIYIPERSEEGNIVQTVYREKETNNIQIMEDFVLGKSYYPFPHPKDEGYKDYGDKENYFSRIIDLLSNI